MKYLDSGYILKAMSIAFVSEIDIKYKIKRNQRCCWNEQTGRLDLAITEKRKIVRAIE